jgi:hypothetical protein
MENVLERVTEKMSQWDLTSDSKKYALSYSTPGNKKQQFIFRYGCYQHQH